MDYYNNNYYRGDALDNRSPPHQQPYYQYASNANYRGVDPQYHHQQQQGRFNNNHPSSKSGRRNSRVRSMDQLYYDEDSPQSPYTGYYNNDRPLINYSRRSLYYKNSNNEEDSPYFRTSPEQHYQETVYAVPPKRNSNSSSGSGRSRMNNVQKYNDYPITPEEGRSFVYNDNDDEEESNTLDNEIYMNHHNTNTGAETLTAAFQDNEGYMAEEEEEEEEDPTTQMNTMFNAESSTTMMSDRNPNTMMSVHSPTSTLNDDQQLPQVSTASSSNNQQQQQQEQRKKKWYKNVINSTALVFKNKANLFKKRDSVVVTEVSPLSQYQQQNQQPEIQFITATNNDLLGDVLDAQQQKDIITQLSTPTPMSSSFNMSPEKTKITNLDRIWVFRLIDANQPTTIEEGHPIAWIGFDYENQIKIENHLKELPTLPENERFAIFYDSHIRHKRMPVIVTPNDSKGYYFANENQTDLVTLQVTFIENNHQKVTFVYRV